MVQIHSPRPFFPSRFNVLQRVCCCCSRMGTGRSGYSTGFVRRKFKTQASCLMRCTGPERWHA